MPGSKSESHLVRAVKEAAWALQQPIPDRHNNTFEAGTSYRRSQMAEFNRTRAEAVEAGVMSLDDGGQILIDAQESWAEWRRIQNDFFLSDHRAPKRVRTPKNS